MRKEYRRGSKGKKTPWGECREIFIHWGNISTEWRDTGWAFRTHSNEQTQACGAQRAAPSWGHSKHSGRLENRERHREESRGALSKEGAQLCWAAHKQRNTQGQQKDAREASEFLPSNSYWQLISYLLPHFSTEINLQFKSLEGRGIPIFHEEILSPVVYTDTSNLYHTTPSFSS